MTEDDKKWDAQLRINEAHNNTFDTLIRISDTHTSSLKLVRDAMYDLLNRIEELEAKDRARWN